MKPIRMTAAVVIFLLCGSAAEEPAAPKAAPAEPKRFVQLSLKSHYESPITSFMVERRFLPLSQIETYRGANAAPDLVIDVCEYAVNRDVITLSNCVQY